MYLHEHFLLSETDIDKFMDFYRDSFPRATITPKLHLLEDHVVPFLEKWGGLVWGLWVSMGQNLFMQDSITSAAIMPKSPTLSSGFTPF